MDIVYSHIIGICSHGNRDIDIVIVVIIPFVNRTM